MGHPIRANIFRHGTEEHNYFTRFPVHVAVLFSPQDQLFAPAFKEIFLRLDRLTSDYVAFFAVLDPPSDWLRIAAERPWWRQYGQHGDRGASLDDRVLVREIARLFGVPWRSLPIIIVSTDLWQGDFVTATTSPYHIEPQLKALTQKAHFWGRPNIGHIYETLKQLHFETHYHSRNVTLTNRLTNIYEILESGSMGGHFSEQFRRLLDGNMSDVQYALRALHRRFDDYGERDVRPENTLDNSSLRSTDLGVADETMEDAAGRLVAPATVAARAMNRVVNDKIPTEHLDEESQIMLETSLKIGHLLETMSQGMLGKLDQFHIGRRGYHPSRLDFSPGAQGAWKSLELEVNLSVIQAARASRSIPMPRCFAIYDADIPQERGSIRTAGGWKADVNQKDIFLESSRRHRFLPLGEALCVIEALRGNIDESFDNVVRFCINQDLPNPIIEALRAVSVLRNKGSHTAMLSFADYSTVLNFVIDTNVLSPLFLIKKRLRSDRAIEIASTVEVWGREVIARNPEAARIRQEQEERRIRRESMTETERQIDDLANCDENQTHAIFHQFTTTLSSPPTNDQRLIAASLKQAYIRIGKWSGSLTTKQSSKITRIKQVLGET